MQKTLKETYAETFLPHLKKALGNDIPSLDGKGRENILEVYFDATRQDYYVTARNTATGKTRELELMPFFEFSLYT